MAVEKTISVRGFEALVIAGVIPLTIKTTGPLTIGAGKKALDPLAPDIPLLRDSKGRPVIPGSTLKGFLRSIVEKTLLTVSSMPSSYHILSGWIFGTADDEAYGSRIFLTDASVQGTPEIITREHIKLNPEKMSVQHGPFKQEYVAEGTIFKGKLHFRNLPLSFLSLLSQAEVLTKLGVARLGRSKSRGYGCVELSFGDVEVIFTSKLNNPVTYSLKLPENLPYTRIELKISKEGDKIRLEENPPHTLFIGKITCNADTCEDPLTISAFFKWSDVKNALIKLLESLSR